MTQPLCACGQPAPHATICPACEHALAQALETVPALAPELDITLATGYARRTGHILATIYTSTTSLPYDERASQAATELHTILARWVTRLGGQPAALAPMAQWLLRNMDRLRQHPAAGEAVHDITHATGRADRVIDRPPQRVYAGPCDCGRDLLTKPGRTLVSCPACGATYGIAERQEWMRSRLAGHLGSAAYAAAVLPGIGVHVTAAMIRGWHHRGSLEAEFPDGVAHPRYRLGDIVTLALAREAAKAQ